MDNEKTIADIWAQRLEPLDLMEPPENNPSLPTLSKCWECPIRFLCLECLGSCGVCGTKCPADFCLIDNLFYQGGKR